MRACVSFLLSLQADGEGEAVLIPTTPLRELGKTYEDGIHWEKGMHDAKQSGRRKKGVRGTYQRTGLVHRGRSLHLQLQLWLRWIHMQSAALGLDLSFRGCLGDPHPCHTRRVGRRICRAALAIAIVVGLVGRLILGGLGGGFRCRRSGILIVDRLYYRITCLGRLLLLCLRCLFLLLLSFFLLFKN